MTPWDEMASRQGVWSDTADNLKRNLARARWITLCLSVLGAMLAAKSPSFWRQVDAVGGHSQTIICAVYSHSHGALAPIYARAIKRR
jgi:hypothetical protein